MKKVTVTLSDDMYDLLCTLQNHSDKNNSQSKIIARCMLCAADILFNHKHSYFFNSREVICIGSEKEAYWVAYELCSGRIINNRFQEECNKWDNQPGLPFEEGEEL